MNEVEEDRKKKQNLINRKHELKKNLHNLINNNLVGIKNILFIYKDEEIKLSKTWAFDLVKANLQKWIYHCETISKNDFIKNCVFLEEFSDNESLADKLYTPLAYYYILKDRLIKNIVFNSTNVCVNYNLNNGEIKVENFSFFINKFKLLDNDLFYKDFKINANREEIEKKINYLKFEISFSSIKTIENKDDIYLKKFISYNYMKDKNIVVITNLNNSAVDKISSYINEILCSDYSVLKKALLVNILAILYSEIKKFINISYFKNFDEYYLLKWIEL